MEMTKLWSKSSASCPTKLLNRYLPRERRCKCCSHAHELSIEQYFERSFSGCHNMLSVNALRGTKVSLFCQDSNYTVQQKFWFLWPLTHSLLTRIFVKVFSDYNQTSSAHAFSAYIHAWLSGKIILDSIKFT